MSVKIIGTAKLIDFPAWIDRVGKLPLAEVEETVDRIRDGFVRAKYPDIPKCNQRNVYDTIPEGQRACCDALERELIPDSWSSFPPDQTKEYKFQGHKEEHIRRLQKILEFSTEYQQSVNVGYWSSDAAYLFLGNPKTGFTVLEPEKYMEFIPLRNWSAMTPAEAWKAIATPAGLPDERLRQSLVPAEMQDGMTMKGLSESRDAFAGQIDSLNQQLEGIQKEVTAELMELRREIEKKEQELRAKKEELLAELDIKLGEAMRQKDAMEAQIFMLDSQIYDICCYAGETVRFTQIIKGRPAPVSEPVVVYQKLRFLDEDLGRLASIYTIQWDKVSMFEEFLRYHPEAMDIFAPNEKCVVLVRLSRTGNLQSVHNTEYFQTLENYEYYHGGTVGIILRNGESVYLGWTEEERVHIKDDLIPGRTITTNVAAADDPDRPLSRSEKKRQYEKKEEAFSIMDGVVSRHFVYSILQGVLDNSDLLGLPKGTDIGTPGPLVVHSMAENALEDNRFGAFSDLVDRCNLHATRGDAILTMSWIVAHSDRYCRNDRGIGDADRTHDVMCPDCEILPVNLVIDKEVYISLEKQGCLWAEDSDPKARANFRLYPEEYVNLTYMNSVWLKYAINSKRLGGWSLGKVVLNYARAIRYLKKALEYVQAREEKEKGLLDAISPEICKDPDWPVALSEWKLSNDKHPVRNLTEYQAKRFARHLGYNC